MKEKQSCFTSPEVSEAEKYGTGAKERGRDPGIPQWDMADIDRVKQEHEAETSVQHKEACSIKRHFAKRRKDPILW